MANLRSDLQGGTNRFPTIRRRLHNALPAVDKMTIMTKLCHHIEPRTDHQIPVSQITCLASCPSWQAALTVTAGYAHLPGPVLTR